eukprot:scaffold8.g1558.t1
MVPPGLAADLQKQWQQLQRFSQDMEAMWRMQMLREAPAKRDVWKAKVEQVAEETDVLRLGLERLASHQQRRQVEEAQRAELLARRVGGGGAAFDVDAEAVARQHILGSKQVLEESYATGVGILGSMSGQRERLKATHRKVLDVLNSVGLSDSLLRFIERRQAMDKLIAYGGMLLVLLFVGVLYWWLKM